MNGRDGVLEISWFQYAWVEHEGLELWEGNRCSAGRGASTTPMGIVLAADWIGAETKRLPMKYERRQIGNPTQHRAECAEINHDPERPRVIAVPPQGQRRQPRETLRRTRVDAAQISSQHEVLHIEGFEHAWGQDLARRVRLCCGGTFHQKRHGTGLSWAQRAKGEVFQAGKVSDMRELEGEVREIGVAHASNRQAAPTTGRIDHHLEGSVEPLKISPVPPPPYFDVKRPRSSGLIHLQHTRCNAWGDPYSPP